MHSPFFLSFVHAPVHFLTDDLFRTKAHSPGIEQTTLHLSNPEQVLYWQTTPIPCHRSSITQACDKWTLKLPVLTQYLQTKCKFFANFCDKEWSGSRKFDSCSRKIWLFCEYPRVFQILHTTTHNSVYHATCASWSSSFSSLNFILSCLKRWKKKSFYKKNTLPLPTFNAYKISGAFTRSTVTGTGISSFEQSEVIKSLKGFRSWL